MRVSATPSGYLIDGERRTIGPLLSGPVALVAAARGDPTPVSASAPLAISPLPGRSSRTLTPLPVGSPAPDFTLPTRDGSEWSLAAHRGQPLTLLFADPSCPPCLALFHELGPLPEQTVVIISRSDAGENRQLAAVTRADVPILLQSQREIARAYGALETPAAYRVDERGDISSAPAIGKAAVMTLLTRAESVTMTGAR